MATTATARGPSAKRWNAKYPPGTPVRYRRADGSEIKTRTRSKAWRSVTGKPVVLLDDIRGAAIALDALNVL